MVGSFKQDNEALWTIQEPWFFFFNKPSD